MCQRMVPHHEWVEHGRHHFTYDLDQSRWQDLLQRVDVEVSQEMDVVGRIECARMEESTRAAKKLQVSRANIRIYRHLRAEMAEDETIQTAAAAAPNLSRSNIRCVIEAARLVNHKINDELHWRNEPPILRPEPRSGAAETATRPTGVVESTRPTRGVGAGGPTKTAQCYHLDEPAADEEMQSIPDEQSESGMPPPPPRKISVDELQYQNLVRRRDQWVTKTVPCPTETTAGAQPTATTTELESGTLRTVTVEPYLPRPVLGPPGARRPSGQGHVQGARLSVFGARFIQYDAREEAVLVNRPIDELPAIASARHGGHLLRTSLSHRIDNVEGRSELNQDGQLSDFSVEHLCV